MKKETGKIRRAIIHALGGETRECVAIINNLATDYAIQNVRLRRIVCEICRRSDGSYYSWCCDYCANNGECNARGWCDAFAPAKMEGKK